MYEHKNIVWPHRRFNPLYEEWVLVSPHRNQRPWWGKEEDANPKQTFEYEEGCQLCPGNARAKGQVNPDYVGTYAFDNDFPALLEQSIGPIDEGNARSLYRISSAQGCARVLCYTEKHNLSFANMTIEEISKIIDLWKDQFQELSRKYKWVQIFENKGELMGCSQAHPHGQVWATDYVPTRPQKAINSQMKYFSEHNSMLLQDYLDCEIQDASRIVCTSEHWVAMVPFWAEWPFEILLLPNKPIPNFDHLLDKERLSLAKILQDITKRYDELFHIEFPFSMGWHYDTLSQGEQISQLHAHFYPPLLRSATIKKHFVGFELLAESQRDLLPETAAEILRSAM